MGKDNIPPSLDPGAIAIGASEAGEAGRGGSWVEAMPAQCTHRVALHCGSVWGQCTETKAVAKVSPNVPTLELHGSGDGKGVQPGQGGATGAALQSGPCVSPLHIAGVQESKHGSEAGFVRVSGVCALCCGNDAHAV
jgi:hypothetical protein